MLHEDLFQLSLQKTDAIKTGNMEQLSKLLMQERKLVQAISQVEEKRQRIVEKTFVGVGRIGQERTVSELLDHIDDDIEKKRFEKNVTSLVEVIVKLKQNEQLNKELIQQSMQFIQLSLDMLQPSMKSLNYNEKSNEQFETSKKSVFDSKV